jgi:VTC domain
MPFSTEIRENRAFAAEIKYLVPPDRVDALRQWARARLSPDPYGSGPHGDTYQTNSLYFDTRDFDVFHRRGSFGRSKYRVRRYGDAPELFFERKLKTGARSRGRLPGGVRTNGARSLQRSRSDSHDARP